MIKYVIYSFLSKEAERLGQAVPAEAAPKPAAAPKPTGEKKEYTETRIQVRLPSGAPMVQSFKVQETLAAVRVYVQMKRGEEGEVCWLVVTLNSIIKLILIFFFFFPFLFPARSAV